MALLVIVGSLATADSSHSLLVGGSEFVGISDFVAKQKVLTPLTICTGDKC
jgi:hypothetical protein